MDRIEFAKLIAVACAAYMAELPEETLEIYWRALQSTPYDDAMHRLVKHIERERFFPRVADLRKHEAEGVRYFGTPIDPSKLLTGPKGSPEVAERVLEKLRQTIKRVTPAAAELPKATIEPTPSRVPGACTCKLGSDELCGYCRLWSVTYG